MNDNLGSYFDLRRCVPMTRAEEYACASAYVETKAPHLADRLVTANMRLVVTIANNYRRGQYDLRDLVQEGNRGLIHAVGRYDPQRGIRFCTYAVWWIRAYILRFTMDNWRLVKTGTTQAQRKLFFSLGKERSRLERTGGEVDSKRLASALGVSERDVATMLERFRGGETSLDTPLRSGESETRTMGDSLSAGPGLQPDVRFESAEFSETLRQKLKQFEATLRGRDLGIFQQRLMCEDPVTLADLAREFGVSRERMRQVEGKLKTRIRSYLTREMGDAIAPEAIAA